MLADDIAYRSSMMSFRRMLGQTTNLSERKIIIEKMADAIRRNFATVDELNISTPT